MGVPRSVRVKTLSVSLPALWNDTVLSEGGQKQQNRPVIGKIIFADGKEGKQSYGQLVIWVVIVYVHCTMYIVCAKCLYMFATASHALSQVFFSSTFAKYNLSCVIITVRLKRQDIVVPLYGL